ncbi:hypothetical protein ABZ725_50835 [Streptomyces sp. NPDC006872]|uniref:hypothetical protein n=1 Tax=Streptomyces sp. NPDC006872 TaxID=3155720 RepID=UPI0033EC300B
MAIRALIRRRETESELLAATAEEMATAYEAGLLREEPSRLIQVASGEGAIAARLEEMHGRAEHEVCFFDTPLYLAPPARASARPSHGGTLPVRSWEQMGGQLPCWGLKMTARRPCPTAPGALEEYAVRFDQVRAQGVICTDRLPQRLRQPTISAIARVVLRKPAMARNQNQKSVTTRHT